MKSDNILHLINGMSVFGAERVAMELAQQSTDLCRSVTIGLINGDNQMMVDISSRLQGTNVGTVCFSKGGIFSVCLRLLSFCRHKRITLIHSHGYKSNFLSLVVKIFLPHMRLVATNHNYLTNTLRQRFYRWLDLRVLTLYVAVVAVSEDVKRDMIAGGFSAKRIQVIDNGISQLPKISAKEKKQLLASLGFSEENFFIGIVASLTEEKAHRVLLSAFSQIIHHYPCCRLIIVGDGLLRSDLEAYSCQLGLSSVVYFLGYRADSRQLLNILDVFVLPSYREGLPLALLEAMSIDIPVVATSVGAIPKVVHHLENGLLIEPGSVDQLIDALERIVEDPNLRKTLAKNGQREVTEKYSCQRMAGEYFKVYDGVKR